MSRELGLSSTRGDRKASVTSRDQYGFEIGEGDSKEDGSEEEDSSKRRAKWVKVLNLLSNHEVRGGLGWSEATEKHHTVL